MMKSAGLRCLGWLVWLITALGSIHLGLMAMHYDLIEKFNLQHWNIYIMYTFGVAGVISIIMLLMHCYCHTSHPENCGCCGCK